MKNFLSYKKIIILVFIACFSLNCFQQSDDSKHPLFLKAMNAKEKANYADAEKYLEQFLNQRPSSFRAHLEIALICHNNTDKKIKAIYHYQEALSLSPNTSDAEYITTLIKNAESELYNQLQKKLQDSDNEKITKLQEENRALKMQLLSLKKELEQLTQLRKTNTINTEDKKLPLTVSEAPRNPPFNFPFNYIVEPGDTLSKIAKKIYGNSKFYKNIFEANKDLLQREDAPLMVGQKLIIPAIENQ